MPPMTASRPADADEIRSYEDIVTAHRELCRKTGAGDISTSSNYSEAATRVRRLGALYREPETLTDEMRAVAGTALAAIRRAARTPRQPDYDRVLQVADTWLDHMALLVRRPDDDR